MPGYIPNPHHVPPSYHWLLQEGYAFSFQSFLRRGWAILGTNPGIFFLPSFAIWLIAFFSSSMIAPLLESLPPTDDYSDLTMWFEAVAQSFSSFAPKLLLINVGNIVLSAPLYGSLYLLAHKNARKEPVNFVDMGGGFSYFVPLSIGLLLANVFTALGFNAFIIPGLYLLIAYKFVIPVITLLGTNVWSGLETSRKVISIRWWSFLGYAMFLFLIQFMLGVLPFQLGLLFGTPVIVCLTYAPFEMIFQLKEQGHIMDSHIDEIGQED